MSTPRLLFVVAQVGTAAYLEPLWRRWLDRPPVLEWCVVASESVRARITANGLTNLPLQSETTEFRADRVVASASNSALEESALGRAASARIARIVDTWYGYRRRLIGHHGDLMLPDHVLVIDREARRHAIDEGLPADRITVVGHPAWEQVAPLPAVGRDRVLFVSQPVQRHFGDTLGYNERTTWKLFHETARRHPALVTEIHFAAHPEDDMPVPQEPDVTVVPDGRAALAEVGTVVGMYSSLLIDAALAGRHVVGLQPGANGTGLRAVGPNGMVPLARTVEGLVAALSAAPPETDGLRRELKDSCRRLEEFVLTL